MERRRSSTRVAFFSVKKQRLFAAAMGEEGGKEVERLHADSDDTAGGMSLIFVLPFSVVKT
jgi:hypothetical protein